LSRRLVVAVAVLFDFRRAPSHQAAPRTKNKIRFCPDAESLNPRLAAFSRRRPLSCKKTFTTKQLLRRKDDKTPTGKDTTKIAAKSLKRKIACHSNCALKSPTKPAPVRRQDFATACSKQQQLQRNTNIVLVHILVWC